MFGRLLGYIGFAVVEREGSTVSGRMEMESISYSAHGYGVPVSGSISLDEAINNTSNGKAIWEIILRIVGRRI